MSKRIRPILARASARQDSEALSQAIEAVQLAHEASLVHDDVIDNANVRRGKTAYHVENGIGAAIVKGDALLARGYALAIGTGSPTFASAYAHAIEMTIAGEIEQAKRLGDVLTMAEYEAIIAMKSGDLIACAFATQALLDADRKAIEHYMLGRRIGMFYQMVDDLLDYLPHSNASKPAFGDYRQRRWTWPLHVMGLPFGLDIETRLDYTDIYHCIAVLQLESDALLRDVAAYPAIGELIRNWMSQVRETAMLSWIEQRARKAQDRASYFSRHSKSFSFAARLLPAEYREAIQAIYAFCRFTDDLVDDGADAPCSRLHLLHWWEETARKAHAGMASGIAVIDDAMRVTPDFKYPAQLIAGMRMDALETRFANMKALRKYTHRVAGVVGQWLTAVFGVESKWMLERADELGHAMQLTNILRDVGEDWKRGRVYLPQDRMKAHGVTEDDIRRVAITGETTPAYRALMDELMAHADESYDLAREAIPYLPAAVQRAISAAANIYQGIHDSLRANQYNNGTRRARTSLVGKVRRALPALLFAMAAFATPARAQMREAWEAAATDKAQLPKAWVVLREVEDSSSAVHMAYRGSLELLESRYGSWPPSRIKRAKRGFRLLDNAVAREPTNREVRYIRFMSYRHLPGAFGKKNIVREDSTWLNT